MDRLPPLTSTWRKPAGIGMILALIVVWAVIVVTVADRIAMPWPVQIPFYTVAGIAWIAPLKPLLLWMETGRWRR